MPERFLTGDSPGLPFDTQRPEPSFGQLPAPWHARPGSASQAGTHWLPPGPQQVMPTRPRRRRRLLVLVAMVVVIAAALTTTLLLSQRSTWHMVWHDEFDGAGVTSSDWTVRNDTFAPNEESIVTARQSNVHVDNGRLGLTARREVRTAEGTTRQYTSGYLDTIGHHSFRYGRFEIRARLPQSEGMWPAFWLRADGGLGEIDVMEGVGGVPDSVTQTVHQSTNGGQGKSGHVHRFVSGSTSQWHTYAVQVESGEIQWSVDGRRTFTVKADTAPWIVDTFDKPLNIRLNLQVGGSLPAYYRHPIGATTVFPATYEVDWVRVYQFG